MLSTATGVERLKQSFDTSLPLAPCVQDGRLLLRTSPRTIQGFTVGEKGLVPRWTLTAKTAVGPPILVRDEVYVVVDGAIAAPRLRLAGARLAPERRIRARPRGRRGRPRRDRRARGEGPRPRGRVPPPVAARRARSSSRRGATSSRSTAKTGAVRHTADLETDVDVRASRVVVGYGDVLVTTGKHFTDRGRPADTCRFAFADGGPLEARRGLLLPSGVASLGRDWVGVFAKGDASPLLGLLEGASTETADALELATSSVHAEYLESKTPPTTAGDLVLAAGRVFDAETLAVSRAEAVPCVSRTIPLRDRLLAVETKSRVTAWKSARKPAPPPPPLDLLTGKDGAAAVLASAHAVVEDGRVVAGGFTIDAKTGGLRGSGKPAEAGPWPLASVDALVTDASPRRLVLARNPDDAASAVAAIARALSAADLSALVAPAVEAGDAALARRVLTAAAERGAPEADLARAEKTVLALEAHAGERVEDKAAEVEARLATLLGRETDALVEAAASLPADAPLAYATTLVRAVVERSPFHSGATEWVRSHLPEGLTPRGGFKDLADWLDFLDLFASKSLKVFPPGAKPAPDAPAAVTAALAAARAKWRDDLVGFQNGPLLVVSPAESPGAIARCLTLGRVVCDALDAAFASIGPRKTEDEVLVLHLFPNKSEYLAQSVEGDEGEPGRLFAWLENTAGHYSPSANVTRIFFPSDEEVASVSGTYAHELTHHWIARRRPPRNGDEGDRANGPGYFIVEGFADFVRGFDFDVDAGTGDPLNARAEYADVVAGLREADATPWSKILTMPQSEAYAKGPKEEDIRVPLRWRMGVGGHFGRVNLFYAQAAAATAFLFLADDAKYRPALLDYLYDYYSGHGDPEALLKALGFTAEELGTRIVRWCRSIGAPPPK